jgi:15-cis-phytoene synthase
LRNRVTDSRFNQLMTFEAARAENFFAEASELLPSEDRRSMLPAAIMHSIYQRLLERMKLDGFRLFQKEYRLNKWEKAIQVATQLPKLI